MLSGYCIGQTRTPSGQLSHIISSMDSIAVRLPVEKIYLHTDKPSYFVGDTIWFSGYMMDASFAPSLLSTILYVELESDSNQVVRHWRFPLDSGRVAGHIPLNEGQFPEGAYTLTAFTSWTRNFGKSEVFLQRLHIGPLPYEAWQAGMQVIQKKDDSVSLFLRLRKAGGQILSSHHLEVTVTDGNLQVYNQRVITKEDGSLGINIGLSDQISGAKLSMLIKGLEKNDPLAPLLFPVPISGTSRTDLQFMPEGGQLIAGIPCRVAFKALGQDGFSREVEGRIYDSNGAFVADFKSLHKGMGSFDLLPVSGMAYHARLKGSDSLQRIELPKIQSDGITLSINHSRKDTLINIRVQASKTLTGGLYFLIAQSRNVACFVTALRASPEALYLTAKKSLFPSGIVGITLLDSLMRPVSERLTFVDHDDLLKVAMISGQAIYQPRDSISLKIRVKDKLGLPVKGNFSISVTDDQLVTADPQLDRSLAVQLLLRSELSSYIEGPGYYLKYKTDTAWRALDNLLLSQGWVGYAWEAVFSPLTYRKYAPGAEQFLSGRVINTSMLPKNGIKVQAVSVAPAFQVETRTDQDGRFTFKVPQSAEIIRLKTGQGNYIFVDELKPLYYQDNLLPRLWPWNIHQDTVGAVYKQVDQRLSLENANYTLALVNINEKAVKVKFQWTWNGDVDQVLDMTDFRTSGVTNLFDLLVKRVKGFRADPVGDKPPQLGISSFTLNNRQLSFTFDKLNVFCACRTQKEFTLYLMKAFKDYPLYKLNRIEVDYGSSRAIKDRLPMIRITSDLGNKVLIVAAENEPSLMGSVTGKGGAAALADFKARGWEDQKHYRLNGTYVYRPWPLVVSKQFYRPRYAPATTVGDGNADVRSTIDWVPMAKTDSNGEVKVSFFAAGQKGTYTIHLEGTDENGNIASAQGKILIK